MLRRNAWALRSRKIHGKATSLHYSPEWAMNFARHDGTPASPWHDIALVHGASPRQNGGPLFNYVNEIPKGTREKLEVNLKNPFNPIRQDVKNGKLRMFTYGDIPFNYGCLPQTWEDSTQLDPHTGNRGDGDPLDVVLLTDRRVAVGEVLAVQAAGILAMIDEGETDWKILAIPADELDKWEGDDLVVPERVVEPIRHWFRYYKTTDGKPENTFAFGGRLQNASQAIRVIDECARNYQRLLQGEVDPTVASTLALPQRKQ
jgi:inorganic pyrophosphatase